MAYDSILVDGYSVAHAWPEVVKLQRKSLAAAREALVAKLAAFAAHSGQPVTLVFDGTRQKNPQPNVRTPHCQVLFSAYGETADSVIERCVAEAAVPERILVVTDDSAEQLTVQSLGAFCISSKLFRAMVNQEIGELERRVRRAQTQAKTHFRRGVL